jgi:hypothetical protein
LVPQALLPAITFHLLRAVLAIFLPIVLVRLAPLPRTLQADLLIHRIGGDLLAMIIAAALPLACGLAANPLLGMIRARLKDLLTITATVILHQAPPEEKEGVHSLWKRHSSELRPPRDSAHTGTSIEFSAAFPADGAPPDFSLR